MRAARNPGSQIYDNALHYQNPVFGFSFPDPFVLKFGNSYYGYSTGLTEPGDRVFPVIRSRDLVKWEPVGGAMEILAMKPPLYWAPEVTYFNGQFYLYYSCGNEIQMEIRVATSNRPDGGFIDSGVRLTNEDFAIDPHVFLDSDGGRYLFYATDFLTHTHIGTGTVVDRLVDWFQLEGKPRPVTRARFDWQVYDPCRAEKGNVRWHTVEGPAVLKRKGRYFQMFSGGNWQNDSYGVAYAITDDIGRSDEWRQPVDGSIVRPILQSESDKVLGPGHNSVVLGPNNRERFCVYHSWVDGRRVMSIDRLDFVGERMILLGPTITLQPSPYSPRKVSFPYESAHGEFTLECGSSNFLLKSMLRSENRDGSVEFRISDSKGDSVASIRLGPEDAEVELKSSSPRLSTYPESVSFTEFQDLGIEANEGMVRWTLNEKPWFESRIEPEAPLQISVKCIGARILSLDLTQGYVDLFETAADPRFAGWSILDGPGVLRLDAGRLELHSECTSDESQAITVKGSCFENFEFAANLCSLGSSTIPERAYGFTFLSESDVVVAQIDILEKGIARIKVTGGEASEIRLPAAFSAMVLRQFRFVRIDGMLRIDSEGYQLAEINVGSRRGRIGIVSYGSGVSIEMVRSIRIEH